MRNVHGCRHSTGNLLVAFLVRNSQRVQQHIIEIQLRKRLFEKAFWRSIIDGIVRRLDLSGLYNLQAAGRYFGTPHYWRTVCAATLNSLTARSR